MKILIILLAIFIYTLSSTEVEAKQTNNTYPWWEVQSVDTMKYSRDTSRQFLSDPGLANRVIEQQVSAIAGIGATHVAIATPYDAEFLPILVHWVSTARRYNLNVWFRGNWSGWEGWFDYPPLTRDEHLEKTKQFILDNPELFEDGDIFTGCPECENGGAGDPRMNGDPEGFRQFMYLHHDFAEAAFAQIDKDVAVNFFSMNGDVARLIMDPQTTARIGGIVTVDHYVPSPEQLAKDVLDYGERSQGKVVLGEVGNPIPDLHGNQSEEEQAVWLALLLEKLSQDKNLHGLNYWTSFGGSTKLWNDDGTPRQASTVLQKYFTPKQMTGTIVSTKGKPIRDALVTSGIRTAHSNANGEFILPYVNNDGTLIITADGYEEFKMPFPFSNSTDIEITLTPEPQATPVSFFSRLRYRIKMFFQQFSQYE